MVGLRPHARRLLEARDRARPAGTWSARSPTKSTLASAKAANKRGSGYIELSGTSFAAPIVAGAAAQLLAREPELHPGSGQGRVMASTRDVPEASPNACGVGQVNGIKVGLARQAANPNAATEPVPRCRTRRRRHVRRRLLERRLLEQRLLEQRLLEQRLLDRRLLGRGLLEQRVLEQRVLEQRLVEQLFGGGQRRRRDERGERPVRAEPRRSGRGRVRPGSARPGREPAGGGRDDRPRTKPTSHRRRRPAAAAATTTATTAVSTLP